MIPPLQSLVKYDNPVLVSTSTKKGKGTLGKKVGAPGLAQQAGPRGPALTLLEVHL